MASKSWKDLVANQFIALSGVLAGLWTVLKVERQMAKRQPS
jgi:hypothetical protein